MNATDRARAEKHRDEFGFQVATNRYQELVNREDIDVVDVSTPTRCHGEQIIAALDAGKHLYVDKPLCMTGTEADEIVRRAAQASTVKQIAYHYRFYPATTKAKMLIDAGFLGTPISFRVEYYHSSNLDPAKPMCSRCIPSRTIHFLEKAPESTISARSESIRTP